MAKPLRKRTLTPSDRKRARKPQTPANIGRPSIPYDPQLGTLILEQLAKGEKSLRRICEEHGFPSRSVVYRWVLENRDFAAQYAVATEIQQHSNVDEMRYEIEDVTKTDVNRMRLKLDTIKWTAARLAPKVYGDHINHDHSLVPPPANGDLLSRLLPDERETLRAMLEAAANRQQPSGSEGLVIEQRPNR
jgi:hypothetical protein